MAAAAAVGAAPAATGRLSAGSDVAPYPNAVEGWQRPRFTLPTTGSGALFPQTVSWTFDQARVRVGNLTDAIGIPS